MTITPADITALLGREPFDPPVPGEFLHKTILITGGGGSIGSELVRSLSRVASRIIAYDRSETNLTRLIASNRSEFCRATLIPFLGDVTQPGLLDNLFYRLRPDIVIHAAAYKHLPLLEAFPVQAVGNNVIGTQNVLSAAVKHRATRFVLVSSDKSCRPSSVMGATKRLAELVTLNPHLNTLVPTAAQDASIRPIVVRLGNVLGSSGSVLPLFESQIDAGGPLTVTHPDATRFFMSIPEAAGLILTAAAIGNGGETFVLDMGVPVNIADMARRLAALRNRPDIKIKFTGLRPGEKLSEQLFTGDTAATAHPRIWTIKNTGGYSNLAGDLDSLTIAVNDCDERRVMRWLRLLVPEYKQAHLTEANTNAEVIPHA